MITREGHRSAWSPPPSNFIQPILDRSELVDRHGLVETLVLLVRVLVGVEVPAARRYALAVRLTGVFLDIEVPVGESVPTRLLVDDPAEVAEELAARLLTRPDAAR